MANERRTLDIRARFRDELSAGFRSAGRTITSFGKLATKSLLAIGAGLTAAGAATAGGTFLLLRELGKVTEELDKIAKNSQRLGIASEPLQELAHIAELSGTSIDKLSSGLGRFSKNVEDARKGVVTKVDALRVLGIGLDDVEGKQVDIIRILSRAADAWEETGRRTEVNAALLELFGRSGLDLVPILEAGREGIAAMGAEARKLGFIVSPEQLQKAVEYRDAVTRIGNALQGLRRELLVEIAPALTRGLQAFEAYFVKNREAIFKDLQNIGQAFANFAAFVIARTEAVTASVSASLNALGAVTTGFGALVLKTKRFIGVAGEEVLGAERVLLRQADEFFGKSYADFDRALDRFMSRAVEGAEEFRLVIPKLELPKFENEDPFGIGTPNERRQTLGFLKGVEDGFGRIRDQLNDAYTAGQRFANDLTNAVGNQFSRAIDDVIDRTKSLEEAWKSLGEAILRELAKVAAKAAANRLFADLVNIGRSLIGGAATSTTPTVQVPTAVAASVPTGSAPPAGGTKIPIAASRGGGVTISIVNNISAIDAGGVSRFLERNAGEIVRLYDRALESRAESRRAVRGAIA